MSKKKIYKLVVYGPDFLGRYDCTLKLGEDLIFRDPDILRLDLTKFKAMLHHANKGLKAARDDRSRRRASKDDNHA